MTNLKLPPANRLAAYLTAVSGLAAALAPVVASLNLTSTAGVLGGGAIVYGAYHEWLKGWRQHEAAAADPFSLVAPLSGEQPAQTLPMDPEPENGASAPPEEPGDVLPALPHLPTTDPGEVPADSGDIGVAA